MKKVLLLLPALALLWLGVERSFQIDGGLFFSPKEEEGLFELSHISYAIDSHFEGPSSEIEPSELDALFSRPFHFLKAGKESYAFVSADGTVVLKVFKRNALFPTLRPLLSCVRALLPSPEAIGQRRFHKIAHAYQLGFTHLKEQTGLLYLHLQRTSDLKRTLQLKDVYGRDFFLDLDSAYFVLQKKAELFDARIHRLMREGKQAEAKAAAASLLQLIADRLHCGLIDHDHGIRKNYGFIGEQAVQIDIGDLALDEAVKSGPAFQREYASAAKKIDAWIERHYPTLY